MTIPAPSAVHRTCDSDIWGRADGDAGAPAADYTRRGFVDGIGIRLPTICIRPGRPNNAASGFFSSILREPLVGQEAVLPRPAQHGKQVGPRRTLSMPGLGATVGEQIEVLRRMAGEQAVRLIRGKPDESIMGTRC